MANAPTSPPPPLRDENPGARPGFVWARGHYGWTANQGYAWIPGHWESQQAQRRWVEGRWEQRGNSWFWVEGGWQ
jgi:hypothetical protein